MEYKGLILLVDSGAMLSGVIFLNRALMFDLTPHVLPCLRCCLPSLILANYWGLRLPASNRHSIGFLLIQLWGHI